MQRRRMSFKWTIIVLLYLKEIIVLTECYHIQKCCNKRKQLTITFDSCIDLSAIYDDDDDNNDKNNNNNNNEQAANNNEKENLDLSWLPSHVQFFSSDSSLSPSVSSLLPISNISQINFSYKINYPCSLADMKVISFTKNTFILDNGSLLINDLDDSFNSKGMIFPPNSYCIDRVSLNTRAEHSFVILLCPCLYIMCIRMCCRWKHFLGFNEITEACEYSPDITIRGNLTYMDEVYVTRDTFEDQRYTFIQSKPHCKRGYYYLNNNFSPNRRFWILPNGDITIENERTDINFADYCIHYANLNGTYEFNLRICQNNPDQGIKFEHLLYGTYFLVGTLFLLLTLMVYSFVKELRTSLQSYYLIAHVFSLLVCYATLTVTEFFGPFLPINVCVFTAYVIQFSFISAVLWLHVICIDISRTFKNRTFVRRSKVLKNNKKTFGWFSLYVWGVTSLVSTITAIADNTSILKTQYRPRFAVRRCWFLGSVNRLIFFYLPVSVILLINVYLFLSTASRILKVQKETRKLSNSSESKRYMGKSDKIKETHRLMICAKLLGLMGVTWIFEILSWAIGGPSYYWYLTDAINSLRGLLIFITFCCKKRIIVLLLNKWASLIKISK